jgi:hypothetical protein
MSDPFHNPPPTSLKPPSDEATNYGGYSARRIQSINNGTLNGGAMASKSEIAAQLQAVKQGVEQLTGELMGAKAVSEECQSMQAGMGFEDEVARIGGWMEKIDEIIAEVGAVGNSVDELVTAVVS